MKRAACILILGMLLFNWGGYRLFMTYLQEQSDTRLKASLDLNDYNEEDLISIKVASNLPYYTANSAEYERIDGDITIKGVHYKYVKRRMYNDSLELLCIPNMEKTGLQNAKDKFFLLANDLANDNHTSKKGNYPHLSKFSFSDFTDDHGFVWQCKTIDARAFWNNEIFAEVKSTFIDRLDKPPQA